MKSTVDSRNVHELAKYNLPKIKKSVNGKLYISVKK